MDKSISQKVIEKIKEEKICPKSGWRFFVYRAIVIVLLTFFLVAGALSLGVIFDLFSKFEVESLISRPRGVQIIFLSLPYIWFILAILFSVLVVVEFIKTRHGYKYRTKYIATFFILSMLFLGGILHFFGFCNYLENYLENYYPVYSQITKTPQEVWFQPENGLLFGVIITDNESSCNCLKLKDSKDGIWDVYYSKASIRPRVRKDNGEMIKILGNQMDKYKFEAEEIRPWIGRKMKNMEY